jgi:hypothetical protein
LEGLDDAPDAAGEPGCFAARDFPGLMFQVFFTGSWMMTSVPQSGGDGPMKGQSHDEQQAVEALGVVDMSVLNAEFKQ